MSILMGALLAPSIHSCNQMQRQPNGNCNNFAIRFDMNADDGAPMCKQWHVQIEKKSTSTLHISMNTRQCRLTPNATNSTQYINLCISISTNQTIWRDHQRKVFHCHFLKFFFLNQIDALFLQPWCQKEFHDFRIAIFEATSDQFPFIH